VVFLNISLAMPVVIGMNCPDSFFATSANPGAVFGLLLAIPHQ
jgi:hypothetical protein